METRIVTIDLDARSYDIYIGSGLLYRIADLIPQDLENRSVFIVTDSNVSQYAATVDAALFSAGAGAVATLALPAGEQTKSFASVERLCGWLIENKVNRNSILIAVGGGVIGDLAGFCASVIMRGIAFVQVPTSLLAQVDSSVGGKTGINTAHGKNLVGTFHQPGAVIADIDVLQSLSRRELLAGYAEIVKYGLIRDPGFFSWLEENGQNVCRLEKDALIHAIEASVQTKASIVQADEKETGLRAHLNFGHTFGHALEAAAGFSGRLLHGEAVAIGMCMAFDLSSRAGYCSREEYERVERHFLDIGLPTHASFIQPPLSSSPEQLIEIMRHDKKADLGKMKFIVTNGIGQAFVSDDISESLVRDVLRDSLGAERSHKGHWKSAFSSAQ